MKKILNIILCLGLIIGNFIFINQVVYADGPLFSISGVTNFHDDVLEKEDDMYLVDGFDDQIYVTFNATISNLSDYMIRIGEVGSSSAYIWPADHDDIYFRANFDEEITEYKAEYCLNPGYDDGDYACDDELTTIGTIKIKNVNYNQFQNAKVYLTEVRQGGEKLSPEYGSFNVNDVEPITLKIKGENLFQDREYDIRTGSSMYDRVLLGSALEEGIEITYIPSEENYLDLYYYFNYEYNQMYYKDDEVEYNYVPYFSFYTDDTISSFNATLKYTNSNEPFEELEISYGDTRTIITKKNHNANKTLTYYIKGKNYQNQNYSVTASVKNNTGTFYSLTRSVNGTELNSGYNFVLDNLNLANYEPNSYIFEVTIGNIIRNTQAYYETKIMTINSVSQNDEALTKQNGVYIANSYGNYVLDVDFDEFSTNEEVYIVIYNDSTGNPNTTNYYNGFYDVTITPSSSDAEETYNIYVCDTYSCDNKLYAHDSITVNLTNFEQISNTKITVSNIRQGGKTVTLNNHNITLNNQQKITMHIQGESMIADAEYRIFVGNLSETHLGSELANGIDIIYNPNDYYYNDYFYISFELGNMYLNNYCYSEGNNEYCTDHYYINYNIVTPTNIPTYTANLMYTNYENIPIEKYYGESNIYNINSAYHNSNNGLSMMINGTNFENTNYDVIVTVKRADSQIYTTGTKSISGSLLNSGYELPLTNLTLPLQTNYDNIYYDYEFIIDIVDIENTIYAKYNSLGRPAYVYGDFYQDENQISTINPVGMPDIGPLYELNSGLFANNKTLGMTIGGDGYKKDDTYNYLVEYGYPINSNNVNAGFTYTRTIASGTVTGKNLIDSKLKVTVNSPDNYDMFAYRISIKKGSEILAAYTMIVKLNNSPNLTQMRVVSNGRELHYDNMGYYISISRNTPIDIYLTGIGFTGDSNSINFCYSHYNEYNYYDDGCETFTFSAASLANGTAKATINRNYSDDIEDYDVSITTDLASDYYQGYLSFNFVDGDDFIIDDGDYIFDVSDNIIKDVLKNTTASEFIENITLASGVTAKVYDKNGLQEVTGIVGTGMKLRITDAETDTTIDIDIIVKGDVTGDGNVTITDLVKVKRHLLEISLLEGIYEVAGNVTDTGTINLTDLVQLSQDVAGIQELS